MVLGPGAFDPDAVFFDDIVDDNVLPNPNLAVDGLTDHRATLNGTLDIRFERPAANESDPGTCSLPEAHYDPEQIEVYGWESSLWRKIRNFFRL